MFKSFPKLQIFLFLILYCFFSCEPNQPKLMNEKDFVTIYAQMLTINELNIDSKQQEQLTNKLLAENQIKKTDIEQTIEYLQKNPEKWVDIVLKVRNHIQQLQKESRSNTESNNKNQL
jgi:hypothetical protein